MNEALETFEKTFRKLHSSNNKKYKERERSLPVEDFIVSGKRIIEHLQKCEELENSEVVYNEFPLLEKIERTDDFQVNFKGFIDMVIKTKDARGNTILYIVDFKTCSFGWTREKRTDVELHRQLFLYKYFLCKKFNLEPKNVRTAFLLLKRTPSKNDVAIEFFPVSAGPIVVQRTIDVLNSDLTDIYRKVKEDSFQKNFNICKNKFGDVCPFAGTDKCVGSKRD